jgi:hypothetical protein
MERAMLGSIGCELSRSERGAQQPNSISERVVRHTRADRLRRRRIQYARHVAASAASHTAARVSPSTSPRSRVNAARVCSP